MGCRRNGIRALERPCKIHAHLMAVELEIVLVGVVTAECVEDRQKDPGKDAAPQGGRREGGAVLADLVDASEGVLVAGEAIAAGCREGPAFGEVLGDS